MADGSSSGSSGSGSKRPNRWQPPCRCAGAKRRGDAGLWTLAVAGYIAFVIVLVVGSVALFTGLLADRAALLTYGAFVSHVVTLEIVALRAYARSARH
jgi:hypothetical protein